MTMLSELLFYGGLGVMTVSALAALILLCVSRSKSKKLAAVLTAEYGEKPQHR